MERTTPENTKRISAMFNGVADLMDRLYARWQDEQEYEDIKDYGEVVRKNLPEGFALIRMTKRPFGFDFHIGTGAQYRVFRTAREIGWKRLK